MWIPIIKYNKCWIREDFLEIEEDMIIYMEGTLNSEQDEYIHTYTHIKTT